MKLFLLISLVCSAELGYGKKLFKCEECEESYKSKSGLWRHTSSKHEGLCYSCIYCGYEATLPDYLKTHQANNCLIRTYKSSSNSNSTKMKTTSKMKTNSKIKTSSKMKMSSKRQPKNEDNDVFVCTQ